MDPTSFGLAVIAEARTLAASIKTRIESYRKGPETFQTMTENVDRLARHIEEVEKLLRTFPNAVPVQISVVFDETFAVVCKSLVDANRTTVRSFSKAFAGSSSSAMSILKSKAYRTFRATSLSSEMIAVEMKIEKASNQLLQLTLALGSSLKMQEHQDTILPNIEQPVNVDSAAEVYRCASNAPALTDTVNLDFDAKDGEGEPDTPEGNLKQSVLLSDSSKTVTAAAGVMKSAFGVVGMAGVGKTVALKGLAHDKDVRNRFPDGVLFMTLGQSATVKTVVGELMKILTITGASTHVAAVQRLSSLRDAVDYAAPWFEGRVCLFLVDDVWPTKNSKTGFLADLRQLLRDSPDSHMAISTRNCAIAQYAGSLVRFGARDPLGLVSEKIFMAHAAGGSTRAVWPGKRPDSVSRILSVCAGLPIALSVTGSAVAYLANVHGNFERACEYYSIELEKKRGSLGGQDTLEGVSLNVGILLSLEYLEAEFLKWKVKSSLVVQQCVSELYTSLCVLENQGWISISVLSRLWQLDVSASKAVVDLFCGMNLATLEWRRSGNASSEEAGIVLHDLLLDFCQQEAEKASTSAPWHAQLLNGYLEKSVNQQYDVFGVLSAKLILRCRPRPWWSEVVMNDGYIHKNLARHLLCSGQGIELAALLLDARWTKLRWKIGGISGLKSDFHNLALCFKELESPAKPESKAVENGKGFRRVFMVVQHSIGRFCSERHIISKKEQESPLSQNFEQIFKAVQLSWGRMSDGLRAFQFNVFGRLVSLRKSSLIVDAYLQSVESYTPKPYMAPVNSLFAGMDGVQRMEIRVGDYCPSAACSPCGRFIAAGFDNGIVVVEFDSCEVLQSMEGQNGHVQCVAFASESKNIVSGWDDGKVVVWEWESSDAHFRVLKEHTARVRGVAVSRNGERIFSISEDQTLRIWDASSGSQDGELSLNNPVECIAICAKTQRIALGFEGGALKVLDGCTQEAVFEVADAHAESVYCVSFCPNGQYLATGSYDGSVCMWNTATWTRKGEFLKGHEYPVWDAAFSPDGKHIASFSFDGSLRLWDVESENCVGIGPEMPIGYGSISFSPDGESILPACSDGFVRILDARLEKMPQNDTSDVISFCMSQNGQRAALLFFDGKVQVWDLQRGELISVLLLQDETKFISCISLSPDGRQVVSGGSAPSLWDATTGNQLGHPLEGHSSWVTCVSFSSDGRRFVSRDRDGNVSIWGVKTGKQIGGLLQGPTHHVARLSESLDGRYIVSGEYVMSRDFEYRTCIWNRFDGTIVWKSKTDENNSKDDLRDYGSGFENEKTDEDCLLEFGITDDEAEKIIRNCGQEAPGLWPDCFPKYTSEVYVKDNCLHSNLLGGNTLLGNLPPHRWWRYNARSNTLVACLKTGSVAICRLILQ